jgi:hypothetical protein
MMEWKYTEDIPLIPVEIINPYNSSKSKHLALDFFEIGLLELGTPLGFSEVGFSWCKAEMQ